jgi:hypothetical protein
VLFGLVLSSPIAFAGIYASLLADKSHRNIAEVISSFVGGFAFVAYPFLLLIAIYGRNGLPCATKFIIWNRNSRFMSVLWTFLCLIPGWYIAFLLMDALFFRLIGALLYALVLVYALFVYRCGAISRG